MKVVTAIGNPKINEKLKELNVYEIVGKDIQYEDGIFEILEERKNIDILIVSNNLPEEYDFKILINKIIKIKEDLKIIVFLKEHNQDIENFLNSKNIFDVFYLNKIDDFFYRIKNNIIIKNKKDLKEFKKSILNSIEEGCFEQEVNNNFKKKGNIKQKLKEKNTSYLNTNTTNKTIAITGNHGSGKSLFLAILANLLFKKNKKILLIDMSFGNSTICSLLEVNNFQNKSLIINIKHGFDIICEFNNYLFGMNYNNEFIYSEIIKYKKLYDYILIDLPVSTENELIRNVLNYSDKIIYLLEPNITEMQKANIYLESYINDFRIKSSKIKLILNKTNKYKIERSILETVFGEYEIIGDIEYNEKFNYIINKSVINELPQKLYEKIVSNICF